MNKFQKYLTDLIEPTEYLVTEIFSDLDNIEKQLDKQLANSEFRANWIQLTSDPHTLASHIVNCLYEKHRLKTLVPVIEYQIEQSVQENGLLGKLLGTPAINRNILNYIHKYWLYRH